MNKKIFTFALAGFVLLLALSALSSAYSNYHDNDYDRDYRGYRYGGYSPYEDYDRVDYHYSRDNGNMIKSTDYQRTTEKYWNGRSWVDRTVYVRETRETPYGYGYYQPSYRTNYRYGDNYYRSDFGNYRYGSW